MIRKLLFFILFLTFSFYTSAQAPGNDCSTAVPITLNYGTTSSTGLQAITGPPAYFNNFNGTNCTAGSTFYGGGRDGVYSIDVAVAGDYTFDFANNGTTWKSLAVHSTCPADNDNAVILANCEGSQGTASQRDFFTPGPGPLTIPLAIGTYYIIIDSWPPGAGTIDPAFELLITSPITNDECSSAIELFSDVDCSFVTYTNEGSSASAGVPNPSCGNYQGDDVWFTYEVNDSGEFTVTTEVGGLNDSSIAIYSGSCGALTQIGCNDDFAGIGGPSSVALTGLTPGNIVYIRVWDWGNSGNGTFGICITKPIPPGDNGVFDDCPNERSQSMTSDFACPPGINVSDTVFGNLDGQPTASRLPTSAPNITTCAFATGIIRRYEEINFTVPTTGLYVLEMTATTFDGQGYIVVNDGLFNPGSCATGTFVVGDDDSGVGLRPRLTINLTAGVNYTLITTEWGTGSGNDPYTWTVTTGPDISWETPSAPIEWYTTSSGGSPIETGPGFNPVNYPGSGLTDTSTPGIYSYWYACPSSPGVRTRVDYVIGKHWSGVTSNDWNDPSNWYGNSVPTDTQCIYIEPGTPNSPIINDDIDGDGLNLTIENGATLTLNPDTNTNNDASSLTIQDFIDIQGSGSLILQNDASLIQVNDVLSRPNTGNIIVNRNADIRLLDFVYYSSPVQNFDVSNVYGANTPTNRIYEWIPTTATGYLGNPGNVPIIVGDWSNLNSGTMTAGKGYAVRGPNGHTAGISTATATFDGVPNNGVITQPINSGDYTGGGLMYNPYGASSLTVTALDDNWNLLGNPYPSAIDADAFLLHPTNNIIEGAVHIWTHGTQIGSSNGDSFYDDFGSTYSVSDYITYNISGSTFPNETFGGDIASGQGFFVLALNNNESGSVTFNNSMRDRTFSNTEFYRMSGPNQNISDASSLERHRIWLTVVDQNGSNSNMMVGYIEGATDEKDRLFDAFAREVNNLSLYSKIGEERMIIQGRSLPFNENDQISLGVVLPQPGEYTVGIGKVDGLFLNDNQDIFLEDLQTGTIHNLRAAPYSITASEAVDFENRFVLRFTDESLSLNDKDLTRVRITAPKGNYVKVVSDSNLIDSITIYDLLGRELLNANAINEAVFVFDNHGFSAGAYIVKATLVSGQSKTQKIILKE